MAQLAALLGPAFALGAVSLVALLVGSLLTISKWPWRRRQFSRLQPLEPQPDLSTHTALADQLLPRFEQKRVTYRPYEESSELPHAFRFRMADAFYELTGRSDGINIFGRHEVEEKDYMYNHLDDEADPSVLAAATAQIIVDEEFADILERLLLTNDAAFNEIDRLGAEAEFRYSISVPIAGILTTLAVTWHWWVAGFLIGLVPILVQAVRSQDRSRNLTLRAITLGVVGSRTLTTVLSLAEVHGDRGASAKTRPKWWTWAQRRASDATG